MRAVLIIGMIVCAVVLCGCATQTQTAAEVRTTYQRVWQYEMLQLSDDWNDMWMLNRPSRLTRWVTR